MAAPSACVTGVVRPGAVSWGDPLNYCEVLQIIISRGELLVACSVTGASSEPGQAEITTPRGSRLRDRRVCPAQLAQLGFDSRADVHLLFDLPEAFQRSQDVLFSYGPGYTHVSIRDQISSSLSSEVVESARCEHDQPRGARLQWEGSPGSHLSLRGQTPDESDGEGSGDLMHARPRQAQPPLPRSWSQPSAEVVVSTEEAGHIPGAGVPHASNPGMHFAESLRASLLQAETSYKDEPAAVPKDVVSADNACEVAMKREDGFEGSRAVLRSRDREVRRLSDRGRTSLGSQVIDTTAADSRKRVDTFAALTEAGHQLVMSTLVQRFHEFPALRAPWALGDACACAVALEASHDEAFVCDAMLRLKEYSRPFPPRAVARLLPVVHRLAHSNCEDHALVAMRLALHILQISWPAVVRALRAVATPKTTWDACEEVVGRLGSLYSAVKAMSKSVRLARTNGPLIPVCRKLRGELEEALVSVGRARDRS